MQVDEETPGHYRRGDHVPFIDPTSGLRRMVLMDGQCKRIEVAQSREYWAINKDGGYLYSNQGATHYG